jgi:hypothetical protein
VAHRKQSTVGGRHEEATRGGCSTTVTSPQALRTRSRVVRIKALGVITTHLGVHGRTPKTHISKHLPYGFMLNLVFTSFPLVNT